MILFGGSPRNRGLKEQMFNLGYKSAIDDMQTNLIMRSRTEFIGGRTHLVVTEEIIEKLCNEMRKRCE